MNTLTAACAAIMLAMMASAATAADDWYFDERAGQQGIITPAVATDVFQTRAIARDAKGNMMVCPTYLPGTQYHERLASRPVCQDSKGKKIWRYATNIQPKGKQYVGFRIVSDPQGYTLYEFFWK